MKAVDTNVIVRLLIRDDPQQCRRAKSLLKRAEAEGERLRVPLAVTLEAIWVMQQRYAVSREATVEAIESLLALPVLAFAREACVVEAMRRSRTERIDLADLLIGACARDSGCETILTFDRRAAKTNLFDLV